MKFPLFLIALLAALATAFGEPKPPLIETAVRNGDLDNEAFAEWIDGEEAALDPATAKPSDVLLTTENHADKGTLQFGKSKVEGPRHLRVGFRAPIDVGSVLVKGGGSLSVLKPGAAYPGDMANLEDWISAERLDGRELTSAEVPDDSYGLWVLPPGTKTRALRFTHEAEVTDLEFAGKLNAALVLKERWINVAPFANVTVKTNKEKARALTNSRFEQWKAWENEEKGQDSVRATISPQDPEWISLAWPEPVEVQELIALWAGFQAADVQTFIGLETPNPKSDSPSEWQTVAQFQGILHGYPVSFRPNILRFQNPVKTKALRLKLTKVGQNAPHVSNNAGKRVWLGELMALTNIQDRPLSAVVPADRKVEIPAPPIPIRFNLKSAAYVTLVIERPDGFRVRNLVSETWFEAGENIAWWDGTDDLGRDAAAAFRGVYRIPERFVEPGDYVVRGLVRGKLEPFYEFTVYTSGNPPWSTADNTGAWLANHSPPQAAAFVPANRSPTGEPVVYLGCYITEGPAGMAWVDLKGKKLGGKKWIGGAWTAAPFLAFDNGPKADPNTIVYVAAPWKPGKDSTEVNLRLTAVGREEDKPVPVPPLGELVAKKAEHEIGGIAVYNSLVAITLPERDQILFVNAQEKKTVGTISVLKPRGVAYDTQGRLLVISGSSLVRLTSPLQGLERKVIVSAGLSEPWGLCLSPDGAIAISDQGDSNQVKIFTEEGKPISTIGNPGPSKAGPYDPLHMNEPAGIAIDSEKQLWVTEDTLLPKRVSVWTLDGKLVRTFYGPAKYGGGGTLDPQDKTKFYYSEGRGAMEFALDWQSGTYALKSVYYRSSAEDDPLPYRNSAPETPIYWQGRRYFTNCYNSHPTNGNGSAFVFVEKDGVYQLAAGMGLARQWPLLTEERFKPLWPKEVVKPGKKKKKEGFFMWSDLDGDGKVSPTETTIYPESGSGVTVMPDLSFCVAGLASKSVRFPVTGYTATGVPKHDYQQHKLLADGALPAASTGGNQAIHFENNWTAVTLGIGPFSALSVSGAKDGVAKWSYPSLWPGLHASKRGPRPDRPGELIGTTRLPGGAFDVKNSDAGPFWAIHTNHGRLAFFTYDGLFVGHLFKDMRSGKIWRMPTAVRNMSLADVTLGEEDFWPSLTATSDGQVYLVDGARSAIVRVEGLESVRRLPNLPLRVDATDLAKCREWRMTAEAIRQQGKSKDILRIALQNASPTIDGDLAEWSEADWVDIDTPSDTSSAMIVANGKLHVAWKCNNSKLLQNSGEMKLAPFKTGGALDIMIGANPAADISRKSPVPGDQRLVITLVKGKPWAMLYEAKVPGTKESERVPFSSPWRSITFDSVRDVTTEIQLAQKEGNYEVSIPLSLLRFAPKPGMKLRGDVGILRGSDAETVARLYWSNKGTGIVSDVPSEAELTPVLWGTLEFLQGD